MAEAAIFTCSICGEPAGEICVFCTKDACSNHRCDRCKRCSDCCECEIPLSAAEAPPIVEEVVSQSDSPAQPAFPPEPHLQPEGEPATEEPADNLPPPHENPIF